MKQKKENELKNSLQNNNKNRMLIPFIPFGVELEDIIALEKEASIQLHSLNGMASWNG
jgi:hypothetical protein